MLELRRISKLFAGIPAVEDVSFSARPGEVTGYLGPNGFMSTTNYPTGASQTYMRLVEPASVPPAP